MQFLDYIPEGEQYRSAAGIGAGTNATGCVAAVLMQIGRANGSDTIIQNYDAGTLRGWRIQWDADNRRFIGQAADTVVGPINVQSRQFNAPEGKMALVAMSMGGGTNLRLYVNGYEEDSVALPNAFAPAAGQRLIVAPDTPELEHRIGGVAFDSADQGAEALEAAFEATSQTGRMYLSDVINNGGSVRAWTLAWQVLAGSAYGTTNPEAANTTWAPLSGSQNLTYSGGTVPPGVVGYEPVWL